MNPFILNKVKKLQAIKPDKIYLENVRSFLSVPMFIAKLICEMAVKENLFKKRVGVVCPNCGNILKSYTSESVIGSDIIACINCEHDEREYEFSASLLDKLTYYKLSNG